MCPVANRWQRLVGMTVSERVNKAGSRWTAQVRYRGVTLARTFGKKPQATAWEKGVRLAIDVSGVHGVRFDPDPWKPGRKLLLSDIGTFGDKTPEEAQAEVDLDPVPRRDWSLKRALTHFDETVTEDRKGARQETCRIEMWKNSTLAGKLLHTVTREDVAGWIKGRVSVKGRAAGKPVATSTLAADVGRLSTLYQLAATPASSLYQQAYWGWGLDVQNPATKAPIGRKPPPRDRRLGQVRRDGKVVSEREELTRQVAAGPDGEQMSAILVIALATGMRRGELLDLRLSDYHTTDLGPELWRAWGLAKNSKPRRIQLNRAATAAVEARIAALPPDAPRDARLFTLKGDGCAYRLNRAIKKAGMTDYSQHDLRHEVLSLLAESGWSIPEIKEQSGHTSTAALMRYVNKSRANVRRRIDAMDALEEVVTG